MKFDERWDAVMYFVQRWRSKIAGQEGTKIAGQEGTKIAGQEGTKIAGQEGTKIAGQEGTKIAGQEGTKIAGQEGTKIAGQEGTKIAGQEGTKLAGGGSSPILRQFEAFQEYRKPLGHFRLHEEDGLTAKVGECTWTGSVPPAVAGGFAVVPNFRLPPPTRYRGWY